ncbi:MAG: glutamine-hydrolyzing carbamoyl-phosphate synthase small subunit [Gammaproteobacteria bacterium]|nr:glutamine-hydrolyzing carbamoyl-phosphate synthase small subunit [Gammaproteobacteria bacterium]
MGDTALLALADGSLFWGESIGEPGLATGEVVFNTAMTGYQEILTDPSYCQQIVTLTYPHIGNVGANLEDEESSAVFANGLIVRDLPARHSNWRSQEGLSDYLQRQGVVAMADIDTRRLTRILREKGAQNGSVMAGDPDPQVAIDAARAFPGLTGMDLAKQVSVSERYIWNEGIWRLGGGMPLPKSRPAESSNGFRVVAYDFGIKRNILRILSEQGCQLTVVPAQTSAEEVLALSPDGVFLSNGPGDPAPCEYAITAISKIVDAGIPTFGICLGYQLLALACGAGTVKMKFGHHGANHPVEDLATGRVMISSQNHGFAVDEASLSTDLKATHRSLFDGSLQGIHHLSKPAFGFQGHPEASPGPHDVLPLFNHFMELIQGRR